ncbi:hypothetical protein BIW11_10975 [Tropilaelaps mercedesae]|nr:hypothetical protein BIW11_10975 [Tropilaelaps mercedesae]
MHSPNVPPVPMFLNETTIFTYIIVNGVSRVENVPHQIHLHGLICMQWHNLALTWGEGSFKNVSTISAYFWDVWTPRLVYYWRKGLMPDNGSKKWLSVNASGMSKWCYSIRLVFNCEKAGDRTNVCHSYIRLLGYPDAQIKFNKPVRAIITNRLELSDLKVAPTITSHETYNASTVPSVITDEVTFEITTIERHPLDLITLTWPMLCIVTTILLAGGICDGLHRYKFDSSSICMVNKRSASNGHCVEHRGSIYDFFALRVWVGVFTGVVCGLSPGDHTLHPRLANAAYLSSLFVVLASLGAILIVDAIHHVLWPHSSCYCNSSFALGNSSAHLLWLTLRIVFAVMALSIVLVV